MNLRVFLFSCLLLLPFGGCPSRTDTGGGHGDKNKNSAKSGATTGDKAGAKAGGPTAGGPTAGGPDPAAGKAGSGKGGAAKGKLGALPHYTPPKPHPFTVFMGATLFDGTGSAPVQNAVVVLEGERIRYAGPRKAGVVPKSAHVVDLKGKYIVPGLIDAHVHFFQSGGIYTRPDIMDLRKIRPYDREFSLIKKRLPETLRRTLAAGVTAEVDAGGPMWNFSVRERANATPLAPRVAVAGPLISTVARPQFDPDDLPIIKVKTPGDAEAQVKRQLLKKPDLIKVWFIVSKDKGIAPVLPILKRVIEVSHAHGTRVMVHATQLEAARAAVKLGADILAHSIDDAPVDRAMIQLLKSKKTLIIPTLVVYRGYAQIFRLAPQPSDLDLKIGDPKIIAEWYEASAATGGSPPGAKRRLTAFEKRLPIMAANLKRLHDAGVTLAAGTDAGNTGTLHGTALHLELSLMVKAGLTPKNALLAATRDAAKVFAKDPKIGTLQAGNYADLLVLKKDPLERIEHLEQLHLIVKGGRILSPEKLAPPSPAWLAKTQLRAYNAGDLERFLDCYAEDVEVFDFPSGRLLMSGKATMRRRYKALFQKSPNLHCRLVSRTVSGDTVFDQELVTGLPRGGEVRATAIYEARNGKIQKVWFQKVPSPFSKAAR